jgi:hypothetical protein
MYKEKVIDLETGKEILRDYTENQIAEAEKAQAIALEQTAKAEAKNSAKASALAKLAALGLSADEIAAL